MQIRILGLQGATSISLVTAATAKMTATETAAVLVKTGLAKAQQIQILMSKGLTKEEAEAALATAAHTAATAAGTVATGFFSGALATAKVAVKGLTAALKANPYILLIAAVVGLVAAFNSLSTAAIDASEKSKEAAQEAMEVTAKLDEEKARVNELIEEYKELRDTEYVDADTREKIRDIQKEINSLVDGETSGLDLVNGKLDDQLLKLKQIQLEEAKRNQSDYIAGYSSARKSADDAYVRNADDAGWAEWAANWAGLELVVDGWDEDAAAILNTIDGVEAMWDSNLFTTLTSINFDADSAEEYYDILTRCIEAMENNANFYHQNNDTYNKLVKMRKDYKDFIDTVDEATASLANNAITIEGLNLDLSGKVVDSAESYEDYRNKLIDAVMNSEDLAQAIADGKITRDNITLLVDDAMASNFSGYYDDWIKYKQNLDKINTIKAKFKDDGDITSKINGLSDKEFEIAYELVAGGADFKSFDELKAKIDERMSEPASTTEPYDYYNYKQAEKNYSEHLERLKKAKLSAEKYGNVDLNNLWYFSDTDGGVKGYHGNYGSMASNGYQNFVNFNTWGEMNPGFASSAFAMYDEYEGIKLSVTPYFWAEGHSQPEVLTKDTVHNYIDKLIEEAGDGYTYDDLLRLDAEGIEVDGMHIKGIIADIGDTAEATTEKLRAYSTADAGIMVARQRLYAAMSKTYKEDLSTLWNSKDFEETKTSLMAMAKTVNGITPDAIRDLADESAELAGYLDQDGMSAEFLANILQTEALGGDGFALITENALELNTALEGMTRRFDEVTDAKARYDAALSAGEKDDNFKSYAEAFEALNNEFKEGTVNSNQFWAAAEFIFGADQLQEWGWSDGIDQIYAAMQKNVGVFEDAESAGAGFLDQLYKIAEGGQVIGEDGSVIAEIEKFADGSYEFNVDALYLDELAEKMGLSKEAVLACLEALSMWGDVDYYNMDEVLTAIKDIGLSSDDFEGTAVNVSALTDQLLTLGYTNKEIYELLDSLQEIEGIELINVDSDVATLTESLQNLGIATGEVGEIKINADGLLNLMQSLQYTKEDAQELINKLGEADGITLTNSTGEVKNVDDVLADIETRKFATVESELSTVSSEINNANDAADTLYSKLQMIDGTTVTVSVKLDVKSSILKSLGLQGFAKGTKNAPDGAALVGEEGEELVKSGDRAYLVGTHGAEIVDLNPGDTVYTAEETKRIKRSARGIHGIMPAYSGGYSGGSGGRINTGKTYEDLLPDSGKSSSSNNKSNSDDDKIDTFDWIEVAIDRIERVIDRLKKTAESTYKSLKSKLGAAADEISMVNQEIAMQQKAFNRYMQEANSVGLSEGLKEKVRTGTIDINEYDEDTQKLIKDYQDWYEKALDCEDAIDDLHESLASLYEDNFNNVKDDFENQLELVEHMANQYETGIDMLEARGYLESTKYYSALQDATKGEIAIMNKELAGLEQAFSDAMNSGEIEKYSEAWYAMQAEINGVKEEIAEANVELAEYAKTMREIEWGYFDYTQERISQLTQEADFLIDLMSNSDLHTDKGQLTDEGMATMGLHGQNYNTYMAQADMYAAEILEIDKELANDPYNTELIERREELLGLQQDSILAAEDEKQAIVALVEEGINLELQAMQDLIDKYTESLDTAKDLYEYQKKIKEQAANVASLQKQLSAYENDLTEETRAKVQKLTVELAKAEEELAESEYEQYISDQKKLLDELYLEYETILNQRLDNVDALIGDMITAVNDNSGSINETLTTTADNVGYTMTTNMQNIWNGATNALDGTISKYGDDFSTKFTAVQSVLSSIQANTAAMVAASDEEAQETVDTTNPETTPSAPTTPTTPPATQPTTPSTPEKTITVGGKINAKGAKIYDYAGDTSGENQYFSKDPIYKVLDEKNGYLKVRHHKLSSGVTGWFKKSDVKAYKTGGLVDYTGLAKVDGTPGKPELMLNAEDTKNFLELRDLLRVLSSQSLTVGSSGFGSPTLSGVSDLSRMLSTLRTANGGTFGTTIGDVEITIPIERVDDYNDFVTKLRNDPKFENMLLDVTIGRLAGGSSLAKNKYKW